MENTYYTMLNLAKKVEPEEATDIANRMIFESYYTRMKQLGHIIEPPTAECISHAAKKLTQKTFMLWIYYRCVQGDKFIKVDYTQEGKALGFNEEQWQKALDELLAKNFLWQNEVFKTQYVMKV